MRSLLPVALVVALVLDPTATWGRPARVHQQPEAMVQSLYRLVVARQPVGVSTYPHFLELFGPYLSEKLTHRIKVDRLCEKDWFRQTHERDRHGNLVKPPFAWLELGLFSGSEEQSEPSQFKIRRSEPRTDGSTYVYVSLAEWGLTASGAAAPPSKSPPAQSWDVAVRVVRERGYPVVGDVIYLQGRYVESESKLSTALRMGCRGPRWVGQRY
jgi:hypothetical protein